MTFVKLIEKIRASGTGYWRMLEDWLNELPDPKYRENSYEKIYGFVRGLAAVNFITDAEESDLLNWLFVLSYDEKPLKSY